ncbi:Regulatory protein BlaI [uncultured Clostridium sp.]|uniref:BlaI/MecI/CopY family transcriptional regulator n=1 Tax=uncultured Clostridium sp. TaxID=59620 RepID=UPI00082201B8|nr:BlaI/MecI/CopY family transcriptional regulator [uncultured Clostridium sp.]SCJ05724.1 Regulatory protein BlaI [uncultured Clostridium sp.]
MKEYKLAEGEMKFAEIIWDNEPIKSGDLVVICEKRFSWKKSTTYTVLKKLCLRGILENNSSIVTSLVSKDEYFKYKSEEFVEDTFGGSLPKFLAAFMGNKKLSKKQASELKELIDKYEEE